MKLVLVLLYHFGGVDEEGILAEMEIKILLGSERRWGMGKDGGAVFRVGGKEPFPYDVGLGGGSERR